MNGAWLDGKMPLDHYQEEHGLDSEAITASESPETGNTVGKQTSATPAD